MSKLTLTVNSVEYAGWLNASVTRSIESIAGSFALEISERWNGQPAGARIGVESACRVKLDDDVVITGFVDRLRRKFDASSHGVMIEGRDLAAALVDCTPTLKQRQFNGIGVLEFCQMVADPYGIHIALQDGVSDAAISTTPTSSGRSKPEAKRPSEVGSAGKSTTATKVGNPKAKLTVDPGETAFSLIDRACRMVGLLPVSDGFGAVVLTRSSSARCATALVEGENVLSSEYTFDATKRYARYTVKGQNQTSDTGEDDAVDYEPMVFSDVSSTPDHGIDNGVLRSERELIVMAEGAITPAFANMRADWEKSVRAARATAIEVSVPGWRQSDGSLWPLNALVSVKLPTLDIVDDLLITALTFSQSAQDGTRTQLSLTRPDAFSPEPTSAGGKTLEQWWPGVKGGA